MVCLSADQIAENHLESYGVDEKPSQLEVRRGILTWNGFWIPGPTLEPRRDEGMPTATALMEIPTVLPPAPPPERHAFEMQVHNNSGGGHPTGILRKR